MKSIRQIADENGVTKAAIWKKITPEFRENHTSKLANGMVYVFPEGETLIISSLRKPSGNSKDTVTSNETGNKLPIVTTEVTTMLTMLQQQLDRQAAEIERLHEIIGKEQQLRLEAAAAADQNPQQKGRIKSAWAELWRK